MFAAIVVDGIPVDVLAVQLGPGRNALGERMFDARRKIHATLVANGYLDITHSQSSDVQPNIQAARRS